MPSEFIKALDSGKHLFGIAMDEAAVETLARYYDIVQRHNPVLHLVGPSSPEEFATRHILESLTLLEFLAKNERFADVGTGAGLPSIPCLLVRTDLKAELIENKEKKVKFLNEAVNELQLHERAHVVSRQFEEADITDVSAVTCRALDKFTEKLPRLLKWSGKRKLLLFGGDNLRDALNGCKVEFVEKKMPLSDRRYLFVVKQRI